VREGVDGAQKLLNFAFDKCRRFPFGPRKSLGLDFPGRILTTTSRKPPLRTDKFLGFREELLPQSLRCGVKVRRIQLLRTHSSPKRPHEQQ